MNKNKCSFYADGKCGYWMPDSWKDCVKDGELCSIYLEELQEKNKMAGKIIIDGVGQDAEIVTNAAGGKQSKAPMAMHLIDPNFLLETAQNKAQELEYVTEEKSTKVDEEDREIYNCYRAIEDISEFMKSGQKFYLFSAIDSLEADEVKQIINIAKVLQYGASRYAPNNWRLIPEEEHLNHALIHLVAHIAGDKQDDHIEHAMCRLMMAYATEKSAKFEYGAYVA